VESTSQWVPAVVQSASVVHAVAVDVASQVLVATSQISSVPQSALVVQVVPPLQPWMRAPPASAATTKPNRYVFFMLFFSSLRWCDARDVRPARATDVRVAAGSIERQTK